MSNQALFAGLIIDENNQTVEVTSIGGEPFYVVNDQGFHRHIPSEDVDRQVLKFIKGQIEGNEDLITEQATKMLGQEDLFSRAVIFNQLKKIDDQLETLFKTGIPEEGRAYMGMLGFRIIINIHGEVIRVDQPAAQSDKDDE